MSGEFGPAFPQSDDAQSVKATSTVARKPDRSWLLRRLWCQNPFYLLSVCFVVHAIAHWYNADSGVAFSPWPLFWLTTGYTLMLALTGFVVIRFGRVWDDARSILLIILLLFVQLSLIFDETLVNDPVTGRMLLVLCWGFSAVLSELLLRGIRISLPVLYRLPYHALLALLFFYPLTLVSTGMRLPNDVVLWRIFLFPVVSALVVLTLVPAIRRGSGYTRRNGTPWLWPWYPWSLFVFLGVCLCFRSYALSQSFDPVLGESTQSAMEFTSAFGVYFLIPLVFAVGILLLEIGLIESRRGAVVLAQFVPLLCFLMSFPSRSGSGPYLDFQLRLIDGAGSPIWMTLLLACVYYGFAALRGVRSAELSVTFALLVLTRIGPQTISDTTLSTPQTWPLLVLGAFHLICGSARLDSRLILVACFAAISALHIELNEGDSLLRLARNAVTPGLMMLSILIVGAIFHDDFAWFLRVIGAPLLMASLLTGLAFMGGNSAILPLWMSPVFVASITLLAWGYAKLVQLPLYRLASLLCGISGSLWMAEIVAVYFIRESGWKGASSFVAGISFLAIAICISSWKAGWLRNAAQSLRELLIIPPRRILTE